MEAGQRKRSSRASKTSKKAGVRHAVKAKGDEEEERRRETLKETLREKLELETRALRVVERLLEDCVAEDFLLDCAKFITSANYKDTIEERSIAKLCGYPICSNTLLKVPTQQFKISTKTNKVYDITERKCYCSDFCYKASKDFELQISKTPLWLRPHESPTEITLMKKGDGVSGEEVRIAEAPLREEDIENPAPVNPEGGQGPGAQHLLAPADLGHSDDEGDFVSSLVSQPSGPRVHWGDLPKRTDEGGEEERQKHQENHGAEKWHQEEEPSVEEAAAKFDSCAIAERQDELGGVHTQNSNRKDTSHLDLSEGSDAEPQSNPSPPGLSITQVGMGKRGAARLRALLLLQQQQQEQLGGIEPRSLRQNLLEGLRRTFKEWTTDETKTFLHRPGRLPSHLLPDVKGEELEDVLEGDLEELDEDDLEEVVAAIKDRGRTWTQKDAPSSPAPDYEKLQMETRELELRVQEYYKGTWVLPGEAHKSAGNSQVEAQDQGDKEVVLPLIDSHAQHLIQKRITVEKLTRSLRDIVGSLGLTMNDITTDVNNLVRTFRFTNTNILHKTSEWALIAVVVLHLLSEVSPLVGEALSCRASVEYVNTLMHELHLQQQDLLSLVQHLKAPPP